MNYTPEEIAEAERIVNDIAEHIDNRESRAALRQALAIYADKLSAARESKHQSETQKLIDLLQPYKVREFEEQVAKPGREAAQKCIAELREKLKAEAQTFQQHLDSCQWSRDTYLALNIPQRINAEKRWNKLHPQKPVKKKVKK